MNQEGHPKDKKTNWKGINHNTEREISGGGDSGEYLDGKNGRISSIRGNNMSFEKIRGEKEVYSSPNPGTWYCLGSITVKNQLFEIWVDEGFAEDPIIKIDGVVVANSPGLPFIRTYPVQMDKNDNCLGGEVFITDDNTPPLIFDIKDMVDSLVSDPTKYFADFNVNLYTINLDAPLDIPIFDGLINVGGGGGLPVGQYQYAIRYVNDAGDRTNFGPLTPFIPVVRLFSASSAQYPSVRTYGDVSDSTSQTSYGVKLKFRVTNVFNYDSIEIKRISYNTDLGPDGVPNAEIVARLSVSPGEISIREFTDPADSNVTEILSDDEDLNDLSSIDKAKAIRYHDKRLVLMNVTKTSKSSDGVTFNSIGGEKIFPILDHIGKDGHNDPKIHTYKRNYTSGERFSFAINLFDGSGGRGFSVDDPALRNFEFPNRREKITGNSLDWSSSQLPLAADVTSSPTIEYVFESFDLHDPVQKSDKCSFLNILDDPGVNNEDPTAANKTDTKVNGEGCPDAGYGLIVQSHELGLRLFTPTSASDANVSRHNYRNTIYADNGSSSVDYNPQGFSPNYYSKGIAIAGVGNLPTWAKSFSVVRTRPAGRVVCQGLGMYSMVQGSGFTSGPSKSGDKMWFHAPDIDSAFVGDGFIDSIQANPGEYSIQLISPLGFFSEVYSFDEEDGVDGKDRLVDLMAYARVLKDSGEINPTESGVGISDYVAYNKYRNSDVAGADIFAVDGGNVIIPLTGFNVVTNDRGTFYELQTASGVYKHATIGGVGSNDFEDAGLKDWTEPFYIVNIIQDGKNVIDKNIDSYRSTGYYQKLESIIGTSSGTLGQTFELVDERWQDCIPDLSSGGSLAADEVFVYTRSELNGVDSVWMDVTFLTPAQLAAVELEIATNGFYLASGGQNVIGLYTHTNIGDEQFFINFDVAGYVPAVGEYIYVKYDNRRPLIVFGGDSSVSESIFSPIDKKVTDAGDESQQFEFNAGFPFKKYKTNPRQYIVVRTTGLNKIQDSYDCQLGFIRQLSVMFTCENRSSIQFAYNNELSDQYFPLINYVTRPNRWDNTNFAGADPDVIAADNNIWPDYFNQYPQEWTLWEYGGIRYKQNVNLDYAVKGPIEFFSKPDFGFEENNHFCTAVIWSLSRAINQQDSPGLKTFPSLNRFDIMDDNGEIKLAWDAISQGKGENLYAICDSGICLLLTKKSILSNLSGTDLTTLATDSFISSEYWLSHDVGSSYEMWTGAAEGSIELPTESGMLKVPAIYIPNKESVYRLSENQVVDIVKNQNYFDVISPFLKAAGEGFSVFDRFDNITALYNSIYNEYWLQIDTIFVTYIDHGEYIEVIQTPKSEMFTFSQSKNRWQGTFDYRYDKYEQLNNKIYGSRDLKTFELDKGYIINGANIEYVLTQNTSPTVWTDLEFIRVQVNSDKKPTKVEFLDEDYTVLCKLEQATQGPLYLKKYDGWEQFIPRKDVSVSANRERIQSRLLIYKIFHNLAEDFKVIGSVVQFKNIK